MIRSHVIGKREVVQGCVMHHTYTNILDYDDDIADKLILKFN